MKRLFATAFAVTLVAVISCGDDDDFDKPAPCSTGPAYPSGFQFGSDRSAGSFPSCTPRCEYKGGFAPMSSGAVYIDAVPSGACSLDGYKCSMGVADQCAVHSIICTCATDHWVCGYFAAGGGICKEQLRPPLEPSANSDAG